MRVGVWIVFVGMAGILSAARSTECAAQETVAGQPVTLPGTEQFDLTSKSGETYRIFVAGPKDIPPGNGAPVIYLSDGNSNFPVVLAAAQKQARAGLQAVVVGIGYPTDDQEVHRRRRAVDLTPKTSPEWIKSNAPQMGDVETGGNDRFLAFIEDELKPAIERKFRIDRSRQTLFGHSFGGLFVLHALFSKPESFQTYVASSPSIWWNDGSVLEQAKAFAKDNSGENHSARLFVSIGSLEQRPGPGAPIQRAPSAGQKNMSEAAKGLAESLKASGVTVEFREFAEENHGTVVLPAASRGVRFALEDKAQGPPPASSGKANAFK